MMENSNLPIRTWYLAMAFMTYSKKGITAAELQRQLNHSRYTTIWSLMHRIRSAMGKWDNLYDFEDMFEFDEAYFSVVTRASDRQKLKRRRGSLKQSNVAVMAEFVPLEDPNTGKRSKQCRYFKMRVLDTHKKEQVNTLIGDNFEDTSIVFSDKSTSYLDIGDYVEVHITEKSTKQTTTTTLKWVHIVISNAKRTLLEIYHKIKGKYLQNYLDDFCYKLNRRYFGENLFDRLVIAVTHQYWYKGV